MPEYGRNTVTVYVNDALRDATKFAPTQDHLTSAAAAWNEACTIPPPGGGPTWPYVPSISLNWNGGRPPVDGGADWDHPHKLNWMSTILVEWLPDQVAQRDLASGKTVFATYRSLTNTIVLPGKCPDDNRPQQLPCSRRGESINYRYFDFATEVLKHEIGHSLGLAHDDASASCTDGVMRVETQPGIEKNVYYGYCNFLNRLLDHRQPCNSEEPEPGETHPCENSYPSVPGEVGGAARDFCEELPDACGGSLNPPWQSAGWVCVLEKVFTEDDFQQIVGIEYRHRCGWAGAQSEVLEDVWMKGPRLSVASPADDAVVSGLVIVEGWAMRYFRTTPVTLAVDGASLPWVTFQDDIAAPQACDDSQGGDSHWACYTRSGFRGTFDSTALAHGVHTLSVIALDDALPTVWEVEIEVQNGACGDTVPPSVTITAPPHGATVQGNVTVQATASDNQAVARVDFLSNGQLLSSDSTAPYSAVWSTSSAPNGGYSLTARAADSCGNTAVSAPVLVTVSNSPPNESPAVWIDSPPAGAQVSTRYFDTWGWATDSGGVATLSFKLDGNTHSPQWSWVSRPDVCQALPIGDPRCPNVGWAFTLDTLGLTQGAHTLQVTAFDSLGLSAASSRSFSVSLTAPELVVDGLQPNRVVSGPSVGLWGWSTHPQGIDEVRLEVDGAPIALVTPWTRMPRPDMCAAGYIDPDCPDVGWRALFDSTQFADGTHTVRVVSRAATGVESSVTRTYVFRNNPVGTSVAVVAAEDTYVSSAAPTSSYGSSTRLFVQASTSDTRYSIAKFNLQGITGTLKSARLRLTLPLGPATRVNLFGVTGSWSESSLSWSSMSSLLPTFYDAYFELPGSGATVYLDVTNLVTLGTTVSIAFATESSNSFAFNSSEHFSLLTRPALLLVK